MGTVSQPTCTKPLPNGAEVFTSKGEPFARIKPAKGRAQTFSTTTGRDGKPRIVVTSGTYLAKYRDGSGIVRKVETGCCDEGAARSVLGELERRAELVRSDVVTTASPPTTSRRFERPEPLGRTVASLPHCLPQAAPIWGKRSPLLSLRRHKASVTITPA